MRPATTSAPDCLIDDRKDTRTSRLKGPTDFKETTMTVRAILDTKGHHILSIEPEEKLSAAVKILGERKIGAVLVMHQALVRCTPQTGHPGVRHACQQRGH